MLIFVFGEIIKNIEISVFGDILVNFRNDEKFEIFVRDIVYWDW